MAELDEGARLALSYIHHQASKSLSDLRLLAERAAAEFDRCLQNISEEQARFKPGREWSIKEVLDHPIYATASQVIASIRDLYDGSVPRPFTVDSSDGRSTQSLQELRDEMAGGLEEIVVLLSALPDSARPPGIWEHPSLGPLNLKELIAYHRLHVMDHLQQIEKIKADPGYPPS